MCYSYQNRGLAWYLMDEDDLAWFGGNLRMDGEDLGMIWTIWCGRKDYVLDPLRTRSPDHDRKDSPKKEQDLMGKKKTIRMKKEDDFTELIGEFVEYLEDKTIEFCCGKYVCFLCLFWAEHRSIRIIICDE
eukprot:929461_1